MDDQRSDRRSSEQGVRHPRDRGVRRAFLGAAISVVVLGAASLAIAQTSPPPPETLSAEGRAAVAEWDRGPQPPKDLPSRRAFFDKLEADFGAQQQRRYGVDITASTLAGVPVRLIRAKGAPATGNRILLNLHGGGFQVDTGSVTENVPLAAITRIPVVAVLYRLSPEHPFPSALEDSLAVYRELLKTHKPSEIGIYGTSAGADLGPELIAQIRKERLPEPAVLGVFSGDADFSKTSDSLASSPLDIGRIYRAYAGATPLTDPIISPGLGAVDFFPPTLCMSSSRDFLLSSTANFCRKLELSGVENKLVVFDGLPHGFWCYLDTPESDQAFAIMAKFLMAHLASAHRP
jgi:monoterpene epsilon-lactone hydrolase